MRLQNFQVLQQEADGFARLDPGGGERIELKAGGPYSVVGAEHVFVGDIWILAGQSNMEGCGNLVDIEEPSPFVHSFQSREQWAVAEEPLHWMNESPRPVHRAIWGHPPLTGEPEPRNPDRRHGAGLGLTFAKLRYSSTGVPVGLVPCAHGGTSMAQWDARLRSCGGDSLYGATILRSRAVGGKVAGILWYQGESDTDPVNAPEYTRRMIELIDAFRTDLAQPDLPFYYVQIGRWVSPENPRDVSGWNSVREAQRRLCKTVPNTAMVSSIDLDVDDGVHISAAGHKALGKRLADVASGHLAPDFAHAQYDAVAGRIRVTFDNVRGGLRSAGRPAGFSLRAADGRSLAGIYKAQLEGSKAVLHVEPFPSMHDVNLWYGYGLDPYCNITDAEGAGLPAFGPIALG